jgi:hypothetical protein
MPKNLLQDIRKPKISNKKSLPKNSPIPIKILSASTAKQSEPVNFQRTEWSEQTPMNIHSSGGSRYALWIVAIFAVIFLFFSISMFFSNAKISITPKEKDFSLNTSFDAVKDAQSGGIPFEVVVLSGEETKIVPANGVQDSAIEATGKVVIYNAYSSTSQILAMNTKLEGSNGKIYKIDSKITVPGISKDGTPGSAEVGIYASDSGEAYNSAPLDFQIIAFKYGPKYNKIYGRSKGEIAGGFKGSVPKIADADSVAALTELKTSLQSKLFKKVSYDIKPGFILFKDAVFLNIDPIQAQPQIEGDTAKISLKGSLSGFVFDEKVLTKAIALNLMPQYDGADIYIPKIKDLVFSLSSKDADSLTDAQKITFTLTGNPKIVWKVDAEQLAADLLGSEKKDFNTILSKYPAISSGDLALQPAWQSSLPKKSKDIKLTVNNPE